MKPCDHDSRPLYEKLIEPLRARARELGYALGVHGTLKRDIDIIACPWTSEAVEANELAEQLRLVALKVHGAAYMTGREGNDPFHQEGCLGFKAHGRRTWCFHLGGGPYLDISVMPRTSPEVDAPTVDEMKAEIRMRLEMNRQDDIKIAALKAALTALAPIATAGVGLAAMAIDKKERVDAAFAELVDQAKKLSAIHVELGPDNEPRCSLCKRKDYPLEAHKC